MKSIDDFGGATPQEEEEWRRLEHKADLARDAGAFDPDGVIDGELGRDFVRLAVGAFVAIAAGIILFLWWRAGA